jgi:hypothetical protein
MRKNAYEAGVWIIHGPTLADEDWSGSAGYTAAQ